MHPNTCMLYSERQFTEREAWLARRARFQVVPRPFDEHATMDWSPIYSYSQSRTKYLPTSHPLLWLSRR